MSIDELRRLATEGKISAEHMIQIEGGNTWHPAFKIEGLLNSQQFSASAPSSENIQRDTQRGTAQDKLDSIKNAGKNVQDQIANKLPFIKGKLLGLKATITKSNRNMIITGSSVVACLLIIVIAFSSGVGTQGHLSEVKRVTSQLGSAINSGDADDYMDALENVALVLEGIQKDSAAIKEEIASMNQFEKQAMANEYVITMKEFLQPAVNPTDNNSIKILTDISTNPAHLQRLQEIRSRMEMAVRNHPFEMLESYLIYNIYDPEWKWLYGITHQKIQ